MKTRIGLIVRMAAGLAFASVADAFPAAGNSAGPYVPCKVHEKTAAMFPVRMLQEGVKRGEVYLELEINPAGQLSDLLVTAYTRRDFADAAVQAIKRWQFEPGTVDGRPINSIIDLRFKFELDGVTTFEKQVNFDYRPDPAAERYEYQPCRVEKLDRIPAVISQTPPIYPKQWIDDGRTGKVTVEFYIDETGRTRFPVVNTPSDTLLDAAAIAAIKEWKFEPPTKKNQPTLVRAEQVFDFHPGKMPATKG